jgi:carbon-monoxide dehydrogenase medium subunit
MYPEPFDYYRADSVDEALSLLEEHADSNPTVLSGGHSLVPTMKSGLAAPDVVVDIGDIEEISGVDEQDDSLLVGACTRYEAVVTDSLVQSRAPLLAEATAEIGDKQVRSRGTVGGNVAHADPASDLPAVMLATDARIRVHGPDGTRTIDADDFFLGIYATALGPDELLTAIEIPHLGSGASAYEKKASPSSGYAMIGVAVRLRTQNGTVSEARVAANGAKDHAVRLTPVEEALVDADPADASASELGDRATDDVDVTELMDDLQASPEYRAQLLKSYTARALESAFDRL